MKSKLSKPPEQTDDIPSYPCLKIYKQSGDTIVVMFSGPEIGVCLHSNKNMVGQFSKEWEEGLFTFLPPDISISLSN